MTDITHSRPGAGIAFIVAGMIAISINDMLIKQLSGGYPLHQMVFLRSSIGIALSMVFVYFEGGVSLLKTRHPVLHSVRCIMVVASNMSFFVALAALPLADVTALFFAAPLFITVLSIPMLGEKVGVMRLTAVVIGFAGVILMQRPWEGSDSATADRIVLLLPVLAALTYAINQVMTRKLGATTKASALAVYIQGMFILVSIGFYLVAGDGRYAEGLENPSWVFLLRAWVWPSTTDWYYFIGLGLNSGIVGYCLAQAYRLSDAATVAPFEYIGLPMAVFWGWLFWAEIPSLEVWAGMAMIMGAGLFVFLREKQKARRVARTEVKGRY
ncbi:DMT family transporter [Falsiruegeria mediterranea]|jgi:S-adenosylmethionine uptake transporter|uniref:Riboflavin transporter n=1 Tax=Falsiruegeria mediterranea M17 TaxID=1200281 RepID=A0A2R8C5M6_9RHOB|nr:DMT family transporter [Falsiruegeria mediterranea]SPJ27764.1 Riboflavin transporter [Falsiruegeria mediterranea M17]